MKNNEAKERIVDMLINYTERLKTQIKATAELASMMYIDADYPFKEKTEEVLRQSELSYLRLKEITQKVSGVTPPSLSKKYGVITEFDSYIRKIGEDKWKMHLPPFAPISVRNRKGGEGKLTFYHVMSLLEDYRLKHPGDIQKIENPTVIFEYHMPYADDANSVFDFDNIDSKRTIDAMQGYFFDDDNAFSLNVIHTAKEDSEAYTDIYILPYFMQKIEGILEEELS